MLRLRKVAGILALLAGFAVLYGLIEARSAPVVRRTTIALPDWPRGAAPVRVLLLSDIHTASLAMGPARLARIVDQVNALHPDLVLIAGDFIYGEDPSNAARFAPGLVAPLSRLKARLGILAVPGNHDHKTGLAALRAALAKAHIPLLANQAVERGPLAIAAVDDVTTGHDDLPATMRQLRRLSGARIAVTHSPELIWQLPDDLGVMLAGHTHCGQIVVPLAPRLMCGVVRRRAHHIAIVTGGVGTSIAPFRVGAMPDLWLVTFGPAVRSAAGPTTGPIAGPIAGNVSRARP